METDDSGAEIRGPPRAGQTGNFLSSLGRKPPLQGRGVLALREGLCRNGRRASKVAPQNRILPILSLWMNTQGRDRFVTEPVPQVERVFIIICRPLQGKEYRYENHEHDLPPQLPEGDCRRCYHLRSGSDRMRRFCLQHGVFGRFQHRSVQRGRIRGRPDF